MVNSVNSLFLFAAPIESTCAEIPSILPTTESSPHSKRAKHYSTSIDISKFVIRTSEKEALIIDEAIAEFFFAANVPFEKIEHNSFLKMINKLRPGYRPPNRKVLSGKWLSQIAEKVDNKIKKDLDPENCSRPVTLLQDGWSSVRNDPIIATTIHTGKDSYLLSAKDCEAEKKTADYCLETAVDSIRQCEDKYKRKVFAFCTDNENKMVKMRSELNKTFPELVTYGCSAHYLNLVEKEVAPKSIIKHVIEIQKFFKYHHMPHGWLKAKKHSKMPQLPNDTRWNSQVDCVDTFLHNYSIYREIISENEDYFDKGDAEAKQVREKINNMGIYTNALDLQKQLRSIGLALDKFQSDSVSLSEAVDVWLSLLSDKVLLPFRDVIQKRFNQAITPHHFVAYTMDPKYFGEKLTIQQEKVVEEFLSQKNASYLVYMLSFKAKDEEIFPKVMFEDAVNSLSTYKWWMIVRSKLLKTENASSSLIEFCTYISNLHSCPASSAAIERVFSSFGHVWSKLRNKLKPEKVEQLVKIYRYLNKK